MPKYRTVTLSKMSFFPGDLIEVAIERPEPGEPMGPVAIYIAPLPLKNIIGEWIMQKEFDDLLSARINAPMVPGMYALATNDGGTIHITGVFSVTETPFDAIKKGLVFVGAGILVGVTAAILFGKYLAGKKS